MILFDCAKLGFIMRILIELLRYVRIFVPIILIVLVIVDLAKVVVSNADEKAKKEASSKAVKRLIYAVIVFLVPTIINFMFRYLGQNIGSDNNGTPTDWISCWNYYNK